MAAAVHVLGISAFILRGGKVLVLQRAESEKFLPGYWELPGGKLEHGEHPYAGAAREVLEETGLEVSPWYPFATFHDLHPDGRHYVELSLVCALVGPGTPVVLSADHQACRWVSHAEVETLRPISEQARGVLREGFRTAERER